MKIIMLSSDFLPNIGGIAAHIYHISKALQEIGHTVIILNPIASKYNKIVKEDVDGLTCYRSYYNNDSNKFMRLYTRTMRLIKTFNNIEKDYGTFDILHQHDYMNNEIAANILSKKCTWIWTNHSSGFLIDYNANKKRLLSKILYYNLAGSITVSDEIFNKTKELLPNKKITYIPNGVDIKKFNPYIKVNRENYNIPAKNFIVLCPRRIVKKNGVLYFALAIKKILDQGVKDITFLVLGNELVKGIDKKYLSNVLEILSPYIDENKVKLLGNVPMDKMPEVNSLSDIVVMPSLMEAVSLSALEGMATKKAILSTNVGGLPEIIHDQETGLLVNPKNSDKLAEKILLLKEDHSLREKLAENAYKFSIENYSWLKIATQTQEFYEKFIK